MTVRLELLTGGGGAARLQAAAAEAAFLLKYGAVRNGSAEIQGLTGRNKV